MGTILSPAWLCHLSSPVSPRHCARLTLPPPPAPQTHTTDSISGVLYIQLNTIIAGIVEALAGLIYIKAGFKGEVWKPLIARERRDVKVRSCEEIPPPTNLSSRLS